MSAGVTRISYHRLCCSSKVWNLLTHTTSLEKLPFLPATLTPSSFLQGIGLVGERGGPLANSTVFQAKGVSVWAAEEHYGMVEEMFITNPAGDVYSE